MIGLFSLKTKSIGVAALLAIFWTFTAQAHTTSQGWIDLGGGNLSLVLGSYHGGGATADGSVTIGGQTFNFTTVVSTKPAGLIDGVNNFYGAIYCGGGLGQYDQPTAACTDQPDVWQIADVTGLACDPSHDFTIADMFDATWQDDATNATGWPGSLTIDDCDIEVAIDIKFCSDPNAFNCKKKGVLPVTIFGTDTFDIADIDISTLRLCTEDFSVCTEAPRTYSIADRGDPTSDLGAAQCALLEVEEGIFEEQDYLNPDGFLDLDAAFEASEVQEMLGTFCGSSRNAVSETLVITGLTLDGTMILSVPIGNTGTDQLVKKN